MKKLILMAAAIAAGTPAAVSIAAPVMAPVAMSSAGARSGHGTGTVKAIDMKTGTVTIQHGPIAAVGWPAMTMAFHARQPGMLHDLKPGQSVDFGMVTNGTTAELKDIRKR